MTWNTLPPHLALCGLDGILVPPGLCGEIDGATIAAHRLMLLSAGHLLASWYAQGARSVRLRDWRVEPENTPPDEETWPVTDVRACELLVASVLLGERYAAWGVAVLKAERMFAKEAA